MPDLQPVDGDPFTGASLQPINGDPFAEATGGVSMGQGDYASAGQKLASAASQTWPVRMAEGIWGGITAPGDAMQGKLDLNSPEAPGRVFNAATMAMTGGLLAAPEADAAGSVLGSGPIVAYHASPYDFNQFDMSHIGTGEGAQAYGHGLYFAGNEGVMDQYYKFFASKGSDWDDPHNVAAFWTNHFGGDRDQAIKYLSSPALKNSSTGALDLLKSGDPINPTAGSSPTRYQVSINADPNHFLDWDKPLSEQPQIVQDLARNADLSHMNPGNRTRRKIEMWRNGAPLNSLEEPQGHELYNALTDYGTDTTNNAALTDTLRQAGIPGIKYLDAGSRGVVHPEYAAAAADYNAKYQAATNASSDNFAQAVAERDAAYNRLQEIKAQPLPAPQGTHNYVVFDDKTIQILKKYGIGGLGIGTAAGLKHFQTQPVQGDPYSNQNPGGVI